MRILSSISEMRAASRVFRNQNKTIGFVPTMGALHEGHLSLVRAAKAKSDIVAVSIFVNPTQFGPHEDFSTYPRPFEKDRALLEKEGVDFLFAPSAEEMYSSRVVTYVEVKGLSDRLCGKSRPGHFRGVTTVVAKLFNIVEPDFAFFGQKDAAQVAIIRCMVRDLNFPIEIVACPIVRESDGLAMSSRNAYLGSEERKSALVLSRALQRVDTLYRQGENSTAKLINAGAETITQQPLAKLDYLEIVDPDTLNPVSDVTKPALVALAAFIGKTRLIDNVVLAPES